MFKLGIPLLAVGLFFVPTAKATRMVTPLNDCIHGLLEDAQLEDFSRYHHAEPEGIAEITQAKNDKGSFSPIVSLYTAENSNTATSSSCTPKLKSENALSTLSALIPKTKAALEHDSKASRVKKQKLLAALEKCAGVPQLKVAAAKAMGELDSVTDLSGGEKKSRPVSAPSNPQKPETH